MPQGRRTTLRVRLTPSERQTLHAWQRERTIPIRLALRGLILLLLAEGLSITQVSASVGITRRHVYKWVRRFQTQGLQGLHDRPRRASAHRAWRQA